MAWYTSSRTAGYTAPHKGRAVRRLAAVTTVGLVLTLVQTPAGAATGGGGAKILDPGVGTPAVASAEQREIDSAAAEARESGKRVELESARSADSTTFLEPSGKTTVEITEAPTRIQQDGEWVDIDPSLSKEGCR